MMGWAEDDKRQGDDKAYTDGVRRAKRVKAGEEARELYSFADLFPVPASSEYLSRKAGYQDEMSRSPDSVADPEISPSENQGTSIAGSRRDQEYVPSSPLEKRSLGCIFVGGFLCVFGMMFWMGAGFPDLTPRDHFQLLVVAAAFIAAGVVMAILGFTAHAEGLGFVTFIFLAAAGSAAFFIARYFYDLVHVHPR